MMKEPKWYKTYRTKKNVLTENLTVHQRILRYEKKQKPFVRFPAKYDNKSREELITELIGEGTGHD